MSSPAPATLVNSLVPRIRVWTALPGPWGAFRETKRSDAGSRGRETYTEPERTNPALRTKEGNHKSPAGKGSALRAGRSAIGEGGRGCDLDASEDLLRTKKGGHGSRIPVVRQ